MPSLNDIKPSEGLKVLAVGKDGSGKSSALASFATKDEPMYVFDVDHRIRGILGSKEWLGDSWNYIDFDEYEATFTTLQYFYPRLVHGGILVLDNYYKKEADYDAVNDYFQHEKHKIYNFSVNKGPDYLVRM